MQKENTSRRSHALPQGSRRTLVRRPLAFLRKDARGLAGIEFALIAGFLSISVLNVTDVSVFLYQELQVNEATQMGAQAAWAACDLNHLPVSTKCPSMQAAVTAAIQSTSLGNSVQLAAGFPSDGFYCVASSGALQYVSDPSSPPNNCSAVGNAGTVPGEYVNVQTSFAYTPIFPGITLAAVLPSTITSSSWTRLQ